MSDVLNDRIHAALAQLKAERAAVGQHLSGLQRQVRETAALLHRLDGAIASLEVNSDLMSQHGLGQPPAVPGDLDVPVLLRDLPRGQERLLPFITRGVAKERDGLQSAKMVAAVADDLGTPVSRERLRDAFFDYFDREFLAAHYWNDPDKAFRSAFRRALDRDLIIPVEYPDGDTVYTGGFREVTPGRPKRVEPIGDV